MDYDTKEDLRSIAIVGSIIAVISLFLYIVFAIVDNEIDKDHRECTKACVRAQVQPTEALCEFVCRWNGSK